MDKFGPTLNAYANTGLDKLEGSIPMIKRHPKEVGMHVCFGILISFTVFQSITKEENCGEDALFALIEVEMTNVM